MRLIAVMMALCFGSLAWADESRSTTGTLHGVHFFDAKEGWTVGDDGMILHSIDGGQTWERQISGTKASLRCVTFLDESVGWAVGREERPFGGGSVGVVLFTRDGGLRWQRLLDNALPGLNAVRFTDARTGFLMGDGVDPFASGLFRTTDGGKSWEPVKGTRTPGWSAGDFQDAKNGVLVGPWGKLATYRAEQWAHADAAIFAGRNLRAVQILHQRLLAVGEGGLVLTSVSAGNAWAHADIGLSPEIRAGLDLNAIALAESRVWVIGRPGSIVLRSDDGGATWTSRKTGNALPLSGVHFVNKSLGWAVGARHTILRTTDGGDTWTNVSPAKDPAMAAGSSVLFVNARAEKTPLDLIALAGGVERHPVTVVTVTRPDPANAANDLARLGDRLHLAVRDAGGDVGEQLSSLPLPQHLRHASRDDVMAFWQRTLGRDAPREMLRHLVLALRIWQPRVVITDDADGLAPDALISEAMTQAIKLACDPTAFPEQLEHLGLSPTKTLTLLGLSVDGPIAIDTMRREQALGGSARDAAVVPAGMLIDRHESLPRRGLVFLGRAGAEAGRVGPPSRWLEGLPAPAIVADDRNNDPATDGRTQTLLREARQMVEMIERLPRSEIILTQLVPLLRALPDDEAARMGYQVASAYVRMGEWDLARETFLLLVDRVPAHPLSADAYRWLVQHNVSGEARRRHELKQFALIQPDHAKSPTIAKSDLQQTGAIEPVIDLFPPLSPNLAAREWSRGGIEISKRLALFGSIATIDPRVQFSVQAGKRDLGDLGESRQWHDRFATHVVRGPWAEASAAELWLTGGGPKPRRVAPCRFTDQRPHLDGKLDDECWKSQPAMKLTDASGTSQSDSPTEAWLAYDAEFLYVAVRCRHPLDRAATPVKVRSRDTKLDRHDHVSILLDLDRDYASYFRLEVDQRGCVREDCWGDATWNPKWYVASTSSEDTWSFEAAIPLGELSPRPVTLDTRWACNIVRILPGRGVQSVSQPADVDPRPEGMSLLLFHQDAQRSAPPMPRAP